MKTIDALNKTQQELIEEIKEVIEESWDGRKFKIENFEKGDFHYGEFPLETRYKDGVAILQDWLDGPEIEINGEPYTLVNEFIIKLDD